MVFPAIHDILSMYERANERVREREGTGETTGWQMVEVEREERIIVHV